MPAPLVAIPSTPTTRRESSGRRTLPGDRIRPMTLLAALVVPLLLAGCDLLGTADTSTSGPPGTVLVANQGNFSDANGSVTAYDPATDTARVRAISDLGSIVQSVALVGGRGYIMANSANRIDVFDPATLERVAQIDSVRSPRYMAPVDESTAYVTNLYSGSGFGGGSVTVLDLAARETVTTVEVGDNPEGIAVVGNRAFVANHGFGRDSTVSILDVESHRVLDRVDVDCEGPRSLHGDRDGEVWVFCTGRTTYDQDGNVTGRTDGAVRILDGSTGSVQQRISLDGQVRTAGPGQDSYYSEAARAVFAVLDASRIVRFDTDTDSGPTAVAQPEGADVGAVAYDAAEGILYVGRSPGFTQSGSVQRIDPDGGGLVGSFPAGVAPSQIVFRAP